MDINLCIVSCVVTPEEITRLHKRFTKLDKNQSGALDIGELMSIPGISGNPLVHRVLDVFDSDGGGDVDFKEFILGLGAFSNPNLPAEEKLKLIFRVYDIDRDGFIANGELFLVLKMMVGSNLSDVQLQQIVDKTIRDADLDGDGRVSFDEFLHAVKHGNGDLVKQMSSLTDNVSQNI